MRYFTKPTLKPGRESAVKAKQSRKLAVCNVRQPDGSIRQQICYVPSKFEVFAVYEPKRRMVHAPAFVDKVVLHALVDNILYDALTKSFIRDSHASQTGKGTDDGLMRLKTHMVDYYRREGHGADGWVLKGTASNTMADTWMISTSSVRTRRNCSAFSGMFGRSWTVTALS